MSRIVVNINLTLDGVMQAPGRPDEDTRDGFAHGGWAAPYFDPVMARVAAEGIATMPALLDVIGAVVVRDVLGAEDFSAIMSPWRTATREPDAGG